MKLIPKSNSRSESGTGATPERSSSTGAVVLYENNSAPILGLVVEASGAKHVVLNQFGAKVQLPLQRLLFISAPAKLLGSGNGEIVAALSRISEQAKLGAPKVALAELWELTNEELREYQVAELAPLINATALGVDQSDSRIVTEVALWLALISDKVYFKRQASGFMPRDPELLEELIKAEQARAARERMLELTLSWIEAGLAQASTDQNSPQHSRYPGTPAPAEAAEMIETLESFACENPHITPSSAKEVKNLLKLLKQRAAKLIPAALGDERHESGFAYGILERIGHFNSLTNPAVLRNRPAIAFSPAVLAAASQSNAAWGELSSLQRTRLEEGRIFTIDDESTKDMDDAIALERLPDGSFLLWIHISDVATLIPPDSALESEALHRATSIYLPELVIPMLPSQLSTERASLVEQTSRCALSVRVQVDQHSNVVSTAVLPTKIRITDRLSYNQVDTLLTGEKTLDPELDNILLSLYQIAITHESARLAAGAQKIEKREVQIVIGADGKLELVEIDESSPARALVAEMMIIANCAFAKFAVDSALPFIYRSQEAPQVVNDLSHVPDGPAREFLERGGFKRSLMSVDPLPHASLGVKEYTQVTSPIRRYLDLCNQRQLLFFFAHAKPYYSIADLNQILDATDRPLGIAQTVTKESRRFWLMRYLEQERSQHSSLRGIVLRTDLKHPLIELYEIPLNVLAKTPFPVQPGDRVELRLNGIDPVKDLLRLEVRAKL